MKAQKVKYEPFSNCGKDMDEALEAKHIAEPNGPELAGADVMCEVCPSRRVLALIADKWTMLILPALQDGPRRNSELMRAVGGVSQKMLTQTLRDLERNGLIERHDYGEIPPRVDYRLTGLGRSLTEPIWALGRWAERHFNEVEAARVAFDAAHP
jgi:DNA-binding HxlR family transcriptional regulator